MHHSTGVNHKWEHVYFKKPTWCTQCNEFIWGVIRKQGYKCSVCKAHTHEQCRAFTCPGADVFKAQRKQGSGTSGVEMASKGQRTDLHWAVENKGTPKKKLLELIEDSNETKINSGDLFRQTPLHVACQAVNVEAVKALLETGKVDPNLRNDELAAPLHIIALQKELATDALHIASLLIEYRAMPDAQNDRGTTSLQIACAMENESMVKLLLQKGASLKIRGELGQALHFAVYSGNEKIVQLLLDSNADINATNLDGETPLQYAMTKPVSEGKNYDNVIRLLQQKH